MGPTWGWRSKPEKAREFVGREANIATQVACDSRTTRDPWLEACSVLVVVVAVRVLFHLHVFFSFFFFFFLLLLLLLLLVVVVVSPSSSLSLFSHQVFEGLLLKTTVQHRILINCETIRTSQHVSNQTQAQ